MHLKNLNPEPKKVLKTKHPDSSNIDTVTYYTRSNKITVLFKNGNKYRYKDVTRDEYNEIISSESIGKAINQILIKGGKLCQKL